MSRLRIPVLPSPPSDYDPSYFGGLVQELRLYFDRARNPHDVVAATLNIDINTLPTQASLATLRSGDVYRDTTAGDVLKIKP